MLEKFSRDATPNMVMGAIAGYIGMTVGSSALGSQAAMGAAEGIVKNPKIMGGIGEGAVGAGAGYGVSSLINAGLGGIGAAKMGGGAVAGGSIGAGIGGAVGGIPGMISGYGLGLMGGTGYDLYNQMKGPKYQSKQESKSSSIETGKSKLLQSTEDASRYIENERDRRKNLIEQIKDQFKNGRRMNELTDEQQGLIKSLNPKLKTLTEEGIKNLDKRINDSVTSFDNMLQALDKFKPTSGKISLEGEQIGLDIAKRKAGVNGKSHDEILNMASELKLEIIKEEEKNKILKGGKSKDLIEQYQMSSEKLKTLNDKFIPLARIITKENELKEKANKLGEEELKILHAKNIITQLELKYDKDTWAGMDKLEKIKASREIGGEGYASSDVEGMVRNIKGFASGGIVTHPMLALVGERGPEKITPLNGGSNGGVVYMQPIELTMDGRKLGQAMVRLSTIGS